MKIRNGFVSNSSSSSFVLKGFLLDDIDIKKTIDFIQEYYPVVYAEVCKYAEPVDEEFIHEASYNDGMTLKIKRGNSENGIPEGEWFIGKELQSTGDDGYLENEIIDFQLSNDLTLAKDIFGIESDVKVIVGTECS